MIGELLGDVKARTKAFMTVQTQGAVLRRHATAIQIVKPLLRQMEKEN
jgi:hypothetical protein